MAIRCVLLDASVQYKKNHVLLCIDEFTKSVESHKFELIRTLGDALDSFGEFNLLISTLDAVVMNRSTTSSNRKVEYIPLPPFSPDNCLKILSTFKSSKLDLKQLALESGGHPRILEYIVICLPQKEWKYDEFVLQILREAGVQCRIESILFGLLPLEHSLSDELPIYLISSQLKQNCSPVQPTFQELIKQDFFLNDIFDAGTIFTPRISPLQIRAFLDKPGFVPQDFLDILKGFFIPRDNIQRGEGFEDFHANWERLIRYSLGKSPNYIYPYFPQVQLSNPNRLLIHLTNQIVSNTESLLCSTTNKQLIKNELQASIILPAQGTEGFDMLILDQYQGNSQIKSILIGIEVRYSRVNSTNVMSSNEVIKKYTDARNQMESLVKNTSFKEFNIQPSDIWFVLISFREIENEMKDNFHSILHDELTKLKTKKPNEKTIPEVKNEKKKRSKKNQPPGQKNEPKNEEEKNERPFLVSEFQNLVPEKETKLMNREDFEKKHHFIIMTRSRIRNCYNHPLQILSFIFNS